MGTSGLLNPTATRLAGSRRAGWSPSSRFQLPAAILKASRTDPKGICGSLNRQEEILAGLHRVGWSPSSRLRRRVALYGALPWGRHGWGDREGETRILPKGWREHR